MSAGSNQRSEGRFLCYICRKVFTDPVTTSCGHNFCKNCITQHWDDQLPYKCPLCNETFQTRPQLQVNTLFRDMVDGFRKEGKKAELEKMEDRMCRKHDKPLELFCKTDQTCVCMLCSVLDHKTHEFVPLREEYEGKKAELENMEAETQQMIQKRRRKIEELKESVKISKDAADRETEAVQVFTDLIEAAQKCLEELRKEIQDKQRTAERQAEDFIKDLKQEISELSKRSSELEQLSRSEDHLHLLQSFCSLKDAPPTKDWTEVRVRPPSYEGTVVKAVVKAVSQLDETVRKQMKMMVEAELKKVRQDAVDVTLDPDTANPYLVLSKDGKQVYHGDVRKKRPDNPERFSRCFIVLGSQSFSSGRFYFEVQVKGKTNWTLGVARESVTRKGKLSLRPQDGFWTVRLTNGYEYKANGDPPVRLHVQSAPEKVGVFVDYEEGLVSFYDVDAAALIFCFTDCRFTDKLFPIFNPCHNNDGENSSPLIICGDDDDDDDDDDSDDDDDKEED